MKTILKNLSPLLLGLTLIAAPNLARADVLSNEAALPTTTTCQMLGKSASIPGACSATLDFQTKNDNKHKYHCLVREQITNWTVSPVAPGKRVSAATATSIRLLDSATQNDSSSNADDAPTACRSQYGGLLEGNSLYGPVYTCPKNSAFVDPQSQTNANIDSECGPNPTLQCNQYWNTYDQCAQAANAQYGGNCTPGMTMNDSDRKFEDFMGSLVPNAYAKADCDCSNAYSVWYKCQYSSLAAEYSSCVQRVQSQIKAGTSDCYCNTQAGSGETAGMYYPNRFVFSNGQWSCQACSTDGSLKSNYSGDGTQCVSRCDNPLQAYDSTTKSCVSCDSPNEVRGGKCLAKCGTNEIANSSGACIQACPTGMAPSKDATTGVITCGCNPSAAFPTGINTYGRSAVTITGTGWKYSGSISPIVSGDTVTIPTGVGCACALAPDSATVSVNDMSDTIPAVTSAGSKTYGLVALYNGTVSTNTYACGCPNYNEKFTSVGGVYACRPIYTSVDTVGLALVDVDVSKTLAQNGVVTGATSTDLSTYPTAMLRSPGTSGADLSIPYARKVWRCSKGYILSGTSCVSVTTTLATQGCSDTGGTVKSSDLISALSTGAGSLAAQGKTMANVVNSRLACCMSDLNSLDSGVVTSPKFHCAASAPTAAQSFDQYYDVVAGDSDNAFVKYPNRLYLTDQSGTPVVGFYKTDGSRCPFMETAGVNHRNQLQMLSDVVARVNASPANRTNPFSGVTNAPANVDPSCRFAVRAALEVTCPANNLADVANGTNTVTAGAVPRCATASTIRVHYDVQDLSDPGFAHRTVMRGLSSVGGNASLSTPIDIKSLIQK